MKYLKQRLLINWERQYKEPGAQTSVNDGECKGLEAQTTRSANDWIWRGNNKE